MKCYKVLLLIIVGILSSSFIYAADPTLQDCSGKGLNLTNYNATYNTSGYYRYVNSSMNYTTLTSDNFKLKTNTSFSVWVYTNASQNIQGNIFTYRGTDADGIWLIRVYNSSGNIRIIRWNDTASNYKGYISVSTKLSINTWQNLIVVYNGTMILYLNGVGEVLSPTNANGGTFTNGPTIGNDLSTTGFNFQGLIDEMIFYNMTLNQSAINNITANYSVNANKITAYYRFNNDTNCSYPTYPTANTCTCPNSATTNWNVSMNDNCNIIGSCLMANLSFYGTGTFNFTNGTFNYTKITNQATNSRWYAINTRWFTR